MPRSSAVLRILAPAILTAAIAGCGSASNAPAGAQRNYAPPTAGPPGNPQTVQFSITIPPPASKPAASRRPASVSSGTQSVSVVLAAVNGQAIPPQTATIVNVTAGSPGCAPSSGGYTCTAGVPGALGVDAFTITLYSARNAGGQVLATGTVSAPISAKSPNLVVTNSLSVTLVPIVASLQMIVTPSSLTGGTAANGTVTVQPVDASGSVILGSSGTADLSVTGGNGSVTFGANGSLTTIGLYQSAKFAYDGSTFISSTLTFSASLEGSSPPLTANVNVPVVFAPTPSPSPTPAGYAPAIYVLNVGQNFGQGATVSVYPLTANGNATPIRTLRLNPNDVAQSITVDSSGQLHVGYLDVNGNGAIDTFDVNANGSAAPLSTLTADSSTFMSPVALWAGQNGELLTVGSTTVSNMQEETGALVFGLSASGSAPPFNAWNFTTPRISLSGLSAASVAGLATDSAGNFYVDGSLQSSALSSAPGIYVAPPTASGPSVVVSRTIPGDSTTTIPSTPYSGTVAGLALDSSGKIYESQYGNAQNVLPGQINVFAAGATGGTTDAAPLATITGTAVNVVVGQGTPALPIAVSGSNLYVANGSTNSVLVYSISATGNATPLQTITGAGVNEPAGIAIGISGPGTGAPPKRRPAVSAGMSQRVRSAATTYNSRFERRGP